MFLKCRKNTSAEKEKKRKVNVSNYYFSRRDGVVGRKVGATLGRYVGVFVGNLLGRNDGLLEGFATFHENNNLEKKMIIQLPVAELLLLYPE